MICVSATLVRMKTIRQKLRESRERLGITQEELAVRCKLHTSRVGKWELGQGSPNGDQLVALSEALDVPLRYLCDSRVDTPDDPATLDLRQFDALPEVYRVLFANLEALGPELSLRRLLGIPDQAGPEKPGPAKPGLVRGTSARVSPLPPEPEPGAGAGPDPAGNPGAGRAGKGKPAAAKARAGRGKGA